MLVLSRAKGEVIEIGDAKVEVIEIKPGGRVRLGVTAPHEIPVHRGEVADLIREQERLEPERVTTVWGGMRIGA